MTDRKDGGRLHLHGVIDTSGLTPDDMKRLHDTLRNAGSKAEGALGGERQLHWCLLHNAAGWAAYMLKSATRTARELDIAKDEVFMMNQSMRRAAKLFFERFSTETQRTMIALTVAAREGVRWSLLVPDRTGVAGAATALTTIGPLEAADDMHPIITLKASRSFGEALAHAKDRMSSWDRGFLIPAMINACDLLAEIL